jgi:hypothetical protein
MAGRTTLTGSLTGEELANALGESLIALAPEQYGQLLAFVPDTPWTTTTIHVLQRKMGRIFVDSLQEPRNLVVLAPGDPSTRTLDQAFLFGVGTAEGLKRFVAAVRSPMEIVCDEHVAKLVAEHHPGSRKRESIVHWYERLDDADIVRLEPGPRRLRITEADQIASLVPGWALRTFRTTKELVTGGTCYVGEEGGKILAAAFTVDQSVKYERISVATADAARRRGLGARTAARVIRAVADQGRIPCVVVDRRDPAGIRVAEKLGFNRRAVMTTWVTAFRK